MNTHRALIEYSDNRVELIAAGPHQWCADRLADWLAKNPVTPYEEDDFASGGRPLIVEIVEVR